MRSFLYLLIFVFAFAGPCLSQVRTMSTHSKERKRVWRGWSKKRDAYNPYLKKKNKDKPSVKMARSDKRDLRRQKRAFKRQNRKAKKSHS